MHALPPIPSLPTVDSRSFDAARIIRPLLAAAVLAASLSAHAAAQRMPDDPCAGRPDAFACRQHREDRAIDAWATRVRRSGADLSLRLDSGAGLTLTDAAGMHTAADSARAQAVDFVFRDYVPRANLYVVELRSGHGGHFLVVDAGSGARTVVDGEPVVSPDGRRFAEATQADVRGPVESRISVWRLEPSGAVREWTFAPPREAPWDPADPVWTSPASLRFTRRAADRAGFSLSETAMLLRRGPDGWRMQPAPRPVAVPAPAPAAS